MKLIQTHFEKMAAFWGGFDQQRGYDLRGRKKSLSDPDTGSYFYDYNAFGELITQTDGNGNVTSTRYDRLGRVSRRDSGVDLISEYGYDNCTKGIGKLCVVTAKGIAIPSGSGASVGHQRNLTYDIKGRLQAEETRFATGVAGAMDPSARVYTASTLFDAAGRVREIRYPNGQFVTRHYDAAVAWSKLTASSGKVLWQGDNADACSRHGDFDQRAEKAWTTFKLLEASVYRLRTGPSLVIRISAPGQI